MSDVKRFLAPTNDTCDMDSYQKVVLAADYDALLTENARLRAALEGAQYPNIDNLRNLSVETCTEIGQTVAQLTQAALAERDQIRAELAAIRGQPVIGRVHHNDEHAEPVRAVLNSIGRQLPDNAPLYALPPQQPDAVSGPREQSDVPLYAAINRACSELPDGWSIELNAERDGAWVALLNAELEVVDFPTNNERLDYTVNDAVEFALLSTRQAEEGERWIAN